MLWNAKNGSVRIGDTDMDYVSFGYGKKVLIALPGLSDGLSTVKGKALMLVKPYLPFLKDYTVYIFSRKNKMPKGYSIQNMAEDQAEAMRILGIRKASVLGVSQGGMIAQFLAIDHPERIDKLILTVTAPYANPVLKDCVRRWMQYAKQGNHKALMIDTAEHTYSPARLKKYRLLYPFLGFLAKPKKYRRFFINACAILRIDAFPALHRITAPTLILGGGLDSTVGTDAAWELYGEIPDSQLHIYQALGHGAFEEAPDFYQRVFHFLKTGRNLS